MSEIIKTYMEPTEDGKSFPKKELLVALEKYDGLKPKELSDTFKKEIEQLETDKNLEVAKCLERYWEWYKLAFAEIKIQQNLPEKLDYSKTDHLTKATQVALLKKARIFQERKLENLV